MDKERDIMVIPKHVFYSVGNLTNEDWLDFILVLKGYCYHSIDPTDDDTVNSHIKSLFRMAKPFIDYYNNIDSDEVLEITKLTNREPYEPRK